MNEIIMTSAKDDFIRMANEIARLRAQRDKLLPVAKLVASIRLWHDTFPGGPDVLDHETMGLRFSPNDVRLARDAVVEAEREP